MNCSKLAVVYVRVSTEYQVDNYSVKDQRSLSSLAARYGFDKVETREEQGVSAETITARPVMKAILEDIANDVVGAIIVSSFTRLTRDVDDIDGRIIKKTCRDHDCVIITPERLYDFSNEADDDLADLQFFFAKIQKRMNLKPMIRGEYTKAKNGGFVGLPLSVGYEYQWKEETSAKGTRYVADLTINQEEAEVVRYIHKVFPDYLYRQLAVHLNDLVTQGKVMQFPIKYAYLRKKYNATHRPWRDEDIKFIIKNDLYIGRLQYAVNAKSPYLRGLEPVYTYRPELRILDNEIFERNQRIAAMRKKVSLRTRGSPHLFSGVLRCPLCGNAMSGKAQVRNRSTKKIIDYCYNCAEYQRSGTTACPGYWMPEREIIRVMVPMLIELVQKNLGDHLRRVTATNPLTEQLESELKAEIAKVDTGMKNLLDAVKQGALSIEQVRSENAELQEAKRRLEKRLSDLRNTSQIETEIRAVLELLDNDLESVLNDLMTNRLRFNMFVRLFFSSLTVELDRPGMGWRKGKMKGKLPVCNPRITKFAFEPRFEAYIIQNQIELPSALKAAQDYVENRSWLHGSPLM